MDGGLQGVSARMDESDGRNALSSAIHRKPARHFAAGHAFPDGFEISQTTLGPFPEVRVRRDRRFRFLLCFKSPWTGIAVFVGGRVLRRGVFSAHAVSNLGVERANALSAVKIS